MGTGILDLKTQMLEVYRQACMGSKEVRRDHLEESLVDRVYLATINTTHTLEQKNEILAAIISKNTELLRSALAYNKGARENSLINHAKKVSDDMTNMPKTEKVKHKLVRNEAAKLRQFIGKKSEIETHNGYTFKGLVKKDVDQIQSMLDVNISLEKCAKMSGKNRDTISRMIKAGLLVVRRPSRSIQQTQIDAAQKDINDLYSISEAADRNGIKRGTIYTLINRGLLLIPSKGDALKIMIDRGDATKDIARKLGMSIKALGMLCDTLGYYLAPVKASYCPNERTLAKLQDAKNAMDAGQKMYAALALCGLSRDSVRNLIKNGYLDEYRTRD